MIKANTYCQAVSRKGLKGSTIGVGDYVYVTDLKVAPISRADPYLQRVFVLAFKVDKETGHHMIPDTKTSEDSNQYKVYLIDPRSLEPLSEEETERMQEAIRRDYGGGDV